MRTEGTIAAQLGEAEPRAETMCAAFQATAARSPEAVCLRSADTGVALTWREYGKRVRRIAAGLAALGITHGDTVVVMMTNRLEFHLCDAAAMHLGATPFSIYNTSSPEQLTYLFANAANRVVIADDRFVDRIRAAEPGDEPPRRVVGVDGEAGDLTLAQLEALGDAKFDFDAAWRAVAPDDVLTLIYTSGTTGPPKGVELTHANVLAECRAAGAVLPLRPGTDHVLPAVGACRRPLGLPLQPDGVRRARHDRRRPGGDRAGPAGGAADDLGGGAAGVRKAQGRFGRRRRGRTRRAATCLLRSAIDLATQKVRLVQAGEPVAAEMAQAHARIEEQVLGKLRARIGLDQAEWVICGAAPLPRHVHEFLLALGLPVVEAFGMSECSCLVTVGNPREPKTGTVGRALPGVELQLARDGELLVRGAIVIRRYRADPIRTSDVLDADGWLHTGDIAEIDRDGNVRIIDRKKELIINAAGKNMSPANIEGTLKAASPLIGQAVCIGDGRPYNVALLVLDPRRPRRGGAGWVSAASRFSRWRGTSGCSASSPKRWSGPTGSSPRWSR